METRAPAVVAVVVTTGSGPGLEATLASLVGQSYEELSLLVIANGDSEHVPERVASVAPNAFVKIQDENLGFAAACNEASLMVDGAAFFLFCHDDVRLELDAVQLMVEAAFRTNAGIVTPKVVDYDDPLVLLHVGQTSDRFGVVRERVEPGEIDHGQQDLERDVFVAPGGVTLVRCDLFKTIRGFDPLIPVLGEDLDLCWRAQVAGARIVVAPLAKVAHRQTIVRGERGVSAVGTRRASRQDLERRHRLLVVATGWGRRFSFVTLALLLVLDTTELILSLASRDTDRAGAIVGSWSWLFNNRRRIRERRRQRESTRVLSDDELHRLQVGGASRLRTFALATLREGFDKARGIIPSPVDAVAFSEISETEGVGFAAAFSEAEEFDDLPGRFLEDGRRRPSKFLTSFRAQATCVVLAAFAWFIGSRNLIATHLPLVGRLAPLDSWWSTWRHFFASWSPNGLGTGAPSAPGYGLLAFAGTFVFGRMGILPRVALIGAVPFGAIALARMLKGKVSNRARLIASLSYLALPMGLNMISQGRVDVLIVVAGLPLVLRRTFELLDVPGFRTTPYSQDVPFGHRGWRTSEAGQRMSLIMIVAVLSAFSPATLVVMALIIAGVYVARFFEADDLVAAVPTWRLLGSVAVNVAIFLLPLTVDVAFAGRRGIEVFGLSRAPWESPTFLQLLRGSDGLFGAGWTGWLLPLSAVAAVLLARGSRKQLAHKLAAIATLTLVLETLVAHHWTGSFAPDLDVLIVLYCLVIASLVAVAVSALENDLRDVGFGWHQVVAGFTVLVLVVASAPLLAEFAGGRYDLPTSSVSESLSALAPSNGASYRVLWLGDPTVLPVPGWSVAPGIAAATSMNGLPGGDELFTSPDSGTSDILLNAVKEAIDGKTVDLGQLLAPDGISSIVVLNSAAPELSGVQSSPLRNAPPNLLKALTDQTDLALELQTSSVDVYSNSKFYGVVSTSTGGNNNPVEVSTDGQAEQVSSGSTVRASVAPAGAWTLDANGLATKRVVRDGWSPTYVVPSTKSGKTVINLVLHQFPLNGLLALFVLGMWGIVWLGFGWIQRLEWLFTGRQIRVTARRRRSE